MFPNPLFLASTGEDLTPGVLKCLSSMAVGSSWWVQTLGTELRCTTSRSWDKVPGLPCPELLFRDGADVRTPLAGRVASRRAVSAATRQMWMHGRTGALQQVIACQPVFVHICNAAAWLFGTNIIRCWLWSTLGFFHTFKNTRVLTSHWNYHLLWLLELAKWELLVLIEQWCAPSCRVGWGAQGQVPTGTHLLLYRGSKGMFRRLDILETDPNDEQWLSWNGLVVQFWGVGSLLWKGSIFLMWSCAYAPKICFTTMLWAGF